MSTTDETLTDPTPTSDDSIEDVPVAHDPATFDVGAMVAGVRSARVRVKVQPNGHLLERLQDLADEIDGYPTDDDVPDDLVEEWLETKADFDHVDVFVVEGRSSDWSAEFGRSLKAKGINPDRKGLSDEEKVKHARQAWCAQIAAQIVHPQDVTADHIAAIYAGSEPEGDKLWRAVRQANSQPVKTLMPDFSQRVSRLSRRG